MRTWRFIFGLTTLILVAVSADGRELWSIQPLERPSVPVLSDKKSETHNAIDAFVIDRLTQEGLALSPEADRRTLIRRLTYDLTGLPPAPEEIDGFLSDKSPHAYEALVDRLLASPQYGERWARHWLDVAHFGETHGYDKDKPRPNAWPYRDYVIRSFNEDKPWSQFVEEQVAGDVLYPFTRDGVEALGFLAAGPWDFIGHVEVPESKIDGRVARHLDRDDMVSNTFLSFNSLTVQCARCHDHKFDPVSQEEYYSLQAVFAAVDRTDRDYDLDPEVAGTRLQLKREKEALESERAELNAAIRERAGKTLEELEQSIEAAEGSAGNGDAFGYHSEIAVGAETEKWVQVDLGETVEVKRIVLHPASDDFNQIGDGFGFPIRFKVEASSHPDFTESVHILSDHTGADVINPGIEEQAIETFGLRARFIRVTATRLAPRSDDFIFAMAELRALDTEGNNVALGASVTALDSIEAPVRWARSNLTDGWYPGVKKTESVELAGLRSQRDRLLERSTHDSERRQLAKIETSLADLNVKREALPPVQQVYVAAVHTGTGNFKGTGAEGGMPRPIHLLHRGNVEEPRHEVGPGTLDCIDGLNGGFDLPVDHREGDRRAALAKWLSSRDNPLTWRSIVNRIWQQHFGRGLVETPNDFGHMGSRPTHPELLDWLACTFRDGGQSLKDLHRLMVTSATYRQRSDVSNPVALQNDSGNRLLWRMNRRKLDAEAVRDAMLMVSGRLDRTMGGPSYQDFVIEKPEHSPHYVYRLHDPNDPDAQRRSIYRFLVRSQPQPFMAALDCADPSIQVGRRNESVTALQSLALLNNKLVIALSQQFARRLESEDGTPAQQIAHGFELALGRPPPESELAELVSFEAAHGMENLCRAMFNLNEFLFVD